jgi:hypothetical protein
MMSLLKPNKLVTSILVIASACLTSDVCYAQEDVKNTIADAKNIKIFAKEQVAEITKITVTDDTLSAGQGGQRASPRNSLDGSDINNNKFYVITNIATGQELAITMTYSADMAFYKAVYRATIGLKPLNSNDSTQAWHLYHSNSFRELTMMQWYTKVEFSPGGSGYIVRMSYPDSSNNVFDEKHNSMKMYHNVGESLDYWHFIKLSNGMYRIVSELGVTSNLNPRYDGSRERWNEERCLEAVKVNGVVQLRQMKKADVACQFWQIKEVGDIPAKNN